MRARLRKLLDDLAESFWLVPTAMVLAGMALALGMIEVEQRGLAPDLLLQYAYRGGDTGARTLLGAIASSSIGVAGTIFSITIAALTLASSQMGPRLLRNFTRDRGNQVTLGTLLGTFAYALLVLRTVRGGEDNVFVPHLALTVGIGLALACIGVLVYFVHHVASRINVETVIDLVHRDLAASFETLTEPADEAPAPIAAPPLTGASDVRASVEGYLQQVDEAGLIAWAREQRATVELLSRPGDYIFAGAVVARVAPQGSEGAEAAVCRSLLLGSRPAGFGDLTFGPRQLVEVAARALSPGINDPLTAQRVLDRLAAGLCVLAARRLPSRTVLADDRVVLIRNGATYEQLADAMFTEIRQFAAAQSMVLGHMLLVLGKVVECEREAERRSVLRRHAALVLADGQRAIQNPVDLAAVETAYKRFESAAKRGRDIG